MFQELVLILIPDHKDNFTGFVGDYDATHNIINVWHYKETVLKIFLQCSVDVEQTNWTSINIAHTKFDHRMLDYFFF